ncbi:MAG: hypothetical protein IKJ35_05550 [Clostridia bacterium]|nr:hypothetical protein [Clostridia bacterium]
MNLFLIAGNGCDGNGMAEIRRISRLLPILESGVPCILTGYQPDQLALATEAQNVLKDARVRPTHLCTVSEADTFSKLCLQAELLLERVRRGTLSDRGTLLILAPADMIRAILQAAFYMRPDEAIALSVPKSGTRWIALKGEHFFDLGALADAEVDFTEDEPNPNEDLPSGGFCGVIGTDDAQEKQEEPQHKYIPTYFKTHCYREDAVTFVKTVNQVIKTVQNVIEKRVEWGYGMQRPPDFARNNELRMLRTLMEGAVAFACAKALMKEGVQMGQVSPEREMPVLEEENNYGIDLEPSREQNGRNHGNEMQNSK